MLYALRMSLTLWEISVLAESLISLSIALRLWILSSKVLTNCLPDLIGLMSETKDSFPTKSCACLTPIKQFRRIWHIRFCSSPQCPFHPASTMRMLTLTSSRNGNSTPLRNILCQFIHIRCHIVSHIQNAGRRSRHFWLRMRCSVRMSPNFNQMQN